MLSAHAVALQPAAADHWLAAREQFDSIITQPRSAQAQRMTHSDLENLIETEGRELQRRLLQADLDERGPGTVAEPVVDAQGAAHTHQRTHTRSLTTIFGQITARRAGYGGRALQSLHPLDAQLNLPPESYSHTIRRRVAETAASQSYAQVVATLARQTGAPVPGRQCEELVKRAARDFDAFYAQQRSATSAEVRATSGLLVITSDGKGVPVRKSELRGVTRKAAETAKPRLQHRRSKGQKAGTKRMSTVAAVYTIAPFVRTPEQIARELDRVREALAPRPRPEDKRVSREFGRATRRSLARGL